VGALRIKLPHGRGPGLVRGVGKGVKKAWMGRNEEFQHPSFTRPGVRFFGPGFFSRSDVKHGAKLVCAGTREHGDSDVGSAAASLGLNVLSRDQDAIVKFEAFTEPKPGRR
jgi:hypothetical protein